MSCCDCWGAACRVSSLHDARHSDVPWAEILKVRVFQRGSSQDCNNKLLLYLCYRWLSCRRCGCEHRIVEAVSKLYLRRLTSCAIPVEGLCRGQTFHVKRSPADELTPFVPRLTESSLDARGS